MKITVVNGSEKHGVTYRLKEGFLAEFPHAEVTEFYLPKDCPAFCAGCTGCFARGEEFCKDRAYVAEIERALLEADLVVFTSPAYVMHATGAMKALLDHFGYRWMPHRPAPQMFSKHAAVITQCLGAGAGSTAKDIKHSLSWWGISQIKTFSAALRSDVLWENIPEKKRNKLLAGVRKLARKFRGAERGKPARTGTAVKFKFSICRMLQKSLVKSGKGGLDSAYWQEQGWLNKRRPWKKK